MKRFLIPPLGILFFGALLLNAQADEVVTKDGKKIVGTILKTDGKTLTVKIMVGSGEAEIPYPLANIVNLRFDKIPELQALAGSSNPDDLSKVQTLWEKRFAYLRMPESDAGDIGLVYTRMLLSRQTKSAAGNAVTIARQVEEGDWSEKRRLEATRLRLSALAASGKVEQAMAEAEKIQDISGEDESSLASTRVQARLLQAELATTKLAELEKQWPKWKLMPDKRKERTELLNQALDGYLFPAVFHPELSRLCAEGLYRAAQIHLTLNDRNSARIYANEIVQEYPDTEFKTKAEKLIKENKPDPEKN